MTPTKESQEIDVIKLIDKMLSKLGQIKTGDTSE